jgi:hypothetical protein
LEYYGLLQTFLTVFNGKEQEFIIMAKDNETKQRFIELRASGLSNKEFMWRAKRKSA